MFGHTGSIALRSDTFFRMSAMRLKSDIRPGEEFGRKPPPFGGQLLG